MTASTPKHSISHTRRVELRNWAKQAAVSLVSRFEPIFSLEDVATPEEISFVEDQLKRIANAIERTRTD